MWPQQMLTGIFSRTFPGAGNASSVARADPCKFPDHMNFSNQPRLHCIFENSHGLCFVLHDLCPRSRFTSTIGAIS
jgi:hypothetical protein